MKFEQNLGVFSITNSAKEGEKGFWTRLGTAFPTKSGDGLNLKLNAVPLNWDGRLTLMPARDDESTPSGQ